MVIGEKLDQLKEDIVYQVNLEYNNGGNIDKQFLKNLIDKFNNVSISLPSEIWTP